MSSYLKFYISTSLNNFIVADIYPKAETVLQNIQLQRRRNISVPGQGHWSLQRQFWRMVWNTPQLLWVSAFIIHYSPSPLDIVP